MNRFERFLGLSTEAKVKYLDGEVQILSPGDHVICAMSGEKIPIENLSYWNVERQEAYANAALSFERYVSLRKTD